VVFHDLVVSVPWAGKYTLGLFAGGEEIAQQGVWFGMPDRARSSPE
jgi:hypothetical protein